MPAKIGRDLHNRVNQAPRSITERERAEVALQEACQTGMAGAPISEGCAPTMAKNTRLYMVDSFGYLHSFFRSLWP